MPSDALHLANIGRRGQRQRRAAGVAALAVAAVVLGVLNEFDASRWWRLGVFPLFLFGALGLVQARARTCVALAARRTCDADLAGPALTDADLEILAHRGRAILRRSAMIAAGLTALILMLP